MVKPLQAHDLLLSLRRTNGLPGKSYIVRLIDAHGTRLAQKRPRGDGTDFINLPPGDYVLQLRPPVGQFVEYEITMPDEDHLKTIEVN